MAGGWRRGPGLRPRGSGGGDGRVSGRLASYGPLPTKLGASSLQAHHGCPLTPRLRAAHLPVASRPHPSPTAEMKTPGQWHSHPRAPRAVQGKEVGRAGEARAGEGPGPPEQPALMPWPQRRAGGTRHPCLLLPSNGHQALLLVRDSPDLCLSQAPGSPGNGLPESQDASLRPPHPVPTRTRTPARAAANATDWRAAGEVTGFLSATESSSHPLLAGQA